MFDRAASMKAIWVEAGKDVWESVRDLAPLVVLAVPAVIAWPWIGWLLAGASLFLFSAIGIKVRANIRLHKARVRRSEAEEAYSQSALRLKEAQERLDEIKRRQGEA